MDKKISFRFAVALIILLAIIILGIFYFKNGNGKQSPSIVDNGKIQQNQGKPNAQNQVQDVVLFNRSDGTYEVNLSTKELKPSDSGFDLSLFAGIPKETDSVINSVAVLSQDKSQALVISSALDTAKGPSAVDGSIPIKSADEFICESSSKNCTATDVLASAYKIAGGTGKWYDDESINWLNWDSVKNVLYASANSTELGNVSPIYAIDLGSKTIKKTTGEKNINVPTGAFSPSLAKFVMINDNSSKKWDLSLYDSSDLSAPLKDIDISAMIDPDDSSNTVGSVAWSVDEKNLVLSTSNQIYAINLDSADVSLKYTDMVDDTIPADEPDQGIDSSAIELSPSGRYIVFVDYDRQDPTYDENKSYTVLKAIDLQDNNNVIELLREEDLSID